MAALDTVVGYTTGAIAALTNVTVAAGDSLAVRNAPFGSGSMAYQSDIKLVGFWQFTNAVMQASLHSPRLHDNVLGMNFRTQAALADPRYPAAGFGQGLFPQDTLILQHKGSAAGGNIETSILSIYYGSLPGVDARLIDAASVHKNGLNIIGQDVPLTPGAGGGYTGATPINSSVDNFKANTDYALLGAFADVAAAAVTVKGIDSGNLRVGVPLNIANPHLAGRWFEYLTTQFGLAMIPVFNSANKSAITVEAVTNQAAAALNVTLVMVEMMPGSVPVPK